MRNLLIIIVLFIISVSVFSQSYLFEPDDYYVLAGRLNIRSDPNLSGMVIGSLDVNTKVNIIECAYNEQIIDNVSAYWYKISYNNSYGYIWGGFIAVETFVHDIDNNGIMDYFHYRISKVEDGINKIDMNKDTFIYINGRHIRSNFNWNGNRNIPANNSIFNRCNIQLLEGPMGTRDGRVEYVFCYYRYEAGRREPYYNYVYFFIDRLGNMEYYKDVWN